MKASPHKKSNMRTFTIANISWRGGKKNINNFEDGNYVIKAKKRFGICFFSFVFFHLKIPWAKTHMYF